MTMVELDSTKTTYEKLEKQYHGFIAPAYKIYVHNKDIVKEGMAVDNISVDLSTSSDADSASFSITNAYDLLNRSFSWTDILEPGNIVSIYMGYTDRLQPIFYGYVSSVEFNFSNSGPTIEITAMDISFFMMRSGEPDMWKKVKITDVIKEIARKYGITAFQMDPDTEILEQVAKGMSNDHKFIQKQAENRNLEFFIVGKKLYFREKSSSKTSLMELEWGKNLMTFSLQHDIADQVSVVKVKGTIENTHQVVKAEARDIEKIGENTKTGPDILKKIGTFVEVIKCNVSSQKDAQNRAKNRLQEISTKLVSAKGSCIGIPEIRAGRYIKIGGLGPKLDSTYSIVRATHTIDSSGYTTNFTLEGNAV